MGVAYERKVPGSNLARKNLSFLIQWVSFNGNINLTSHLNTVGTGKPDPKSIIQHSWQENQTQRPYMGFNTVGQENQTQKTIGFNTVGRKTRPRDHIWAKTIYGTQHSGTGKSDPKDDRIQHSWQENQTQRPYMGKDHIWDLTQWDRKIRPKRR